MAAAGCSLLSPHLLPRQALSMDCYSPPGAALRARHGAHAAAAAGGSRDSLEPFAASGSRRGSQVSMALDLHLPNDCPVTLHVRDQTPRRSETARRHQLLRQRPVEDEAPPARARANTGESLASGRMARRGSTAGGCGGGSGGGAHHRRLTHSRSSASDAGRPPPRRRSHLECPRCAAAAAAAAAQGCGRGLVYGAAGTSPLARSPESISPRSVSRANTDDGTDGGASPRSGSVAISMEEPEAGPGLAPAAPAAAAADGEAPRDTRLQLEPQGAATAEVERPPCGANITEASTEASSRNGMT